MRITFYSTRPYDRAFFETANERRDHELAFLEAGLDARTAALAEGSEAVCLFVNDQAGAEALEVLSRGGTRLVTLRSAGFNNVDLEAAGRLGMQVVRVPAYSPHAVAEHTLGLVLCLNRKLHRSYARVREMNFSLTGLLGFDLHTRTVGVVGTGRIGEQVARIFKGIGCRVLAHDMEPNPSCEALGVEYLPLKDLLALSDIVTLHLPLTPDTENMIRRDTLEQMKPGAMLVNTSRGPLVETRDVIEALKSERLGSLALDVYEEEEKLFFRDLSDRVIEDDVFARLLTFPNVLITAHQAFFTHEALSAIAEVTLSNVDDVAAGRPCPNEVTSKGHLAD